MDDLESLKEENEELRYQLFELKNKRSLDYEYNELMEDILDSAKQVSKEKNENEDLVEYTGRIIEYILNFKNDYNLR